MKYPTNTAYRPIPSRRSRLSPSLITPPDQHSGTHSSWTIGMEQLQGWQALFGGNDRPYEVDLGTQQGVILGTTEAGISTSMQRLAFNAASRGWKVFLFDAQGSQEEAATFYATMLAAGHEHVHLFPDDPYDGWRGTGHAILHRLLQVSPFREPYYQHIATTGLARVLLQDGPPVRNLDDIVKRLDKVLQKQGRERGDARQPSPFEMLRVTDLSGPPIRYQALSSLVGNSLNGSWSFDHVDAAYFSFNAWNRPEEAHLQARFLLADLASYLVERTTKETPVLLLIKHPEQLFDPEQITPLFAQMERAHGSLFVAARSTADFGKAAPHLLKNASILLVHRSLTSLPFEPYITFPWWKSHPFLNGTLQRLADRDCFAIAGGKVTQIRITPAPIDHVAIAYARRCLTEPPVPCYDIRHELIPLTLNQDDGDEWAAVLKEVLGQNPSPSERGTSEDVPTVQKEHPRQASDEPFQRRTHNRRIGPNKKGTASKDAVPPEAIL